MNRRINTRLALVIVIILIFLGVAAISFKDDISSRFRKQPQDFGVVRTTKLEYPAGWQEEKLNNADKIAGIILKLKKDNPESSLILKTIVGELEENFDIKTLPDKIVESFKKELTSFDLVDKEVSRIGDFDVVQIRYKQKNNKDKQTYENLIIVIPTQNQTLYLTFRSREADFSSIEGDVDKISRSLADYLKSSK